MESCARVIGSFPDYVEGMSDSARALRVSRHLESCGSCQRRVEIQRRVIRALDEMPQVCVPPDFRSSVMARVVDAPVPEAPRHHRTHSHLRLVHLLVLTAAAVAAASLGAGTRLLLEGEWCFPSLFNPALLAEWVAGLGRIAFALVVDLLSRARLPALWPNLHNPFAVGLAAALITALTGLGLVVGALGLGMLAGARAFLRVGRR